MLPIVMRRQNGPLIPFVANQLDIGTAALPWRGLFVSSFTPTSDINPATDDTYQLGTLTGPKRWKTLVTSRDISIAGQLIGSGGTSTTNFRAGIAAMAALTTGVDNVSVGENAGALIDTGSLNTNIGKDAGRRNASATRNTLVGYGAGDHVLGSANTSLGAETLQTTLGSNNVALGYGAGNHATGNFEFYLTGVAFASNALEKTNSLFYGVFDASPANQTLAVNASVSVGAAAGVNTFTVDGTAFGAGVASVRLNGLTNGAAAQAGTLLNAPVAGNPTFWIPWNIAGVVKHVPAW